MNTRGLLPLSFLSEGDRGVVVKLNGGATFQEKMISMGIIKGNIVEVLSGIPGHPLLILIGNTRLALGFGLTHKIEIEIAN